MQNVTKNAKAMAIVNTILCEINPQPTHARIEKKYNGFRQYRYGPD